MSLSWVSRFKYESYNIGLTLEQRRNNLRISLNATSVFNLAGWCDFTYFLIILGSLIGCTYQFNAILGPEWIIWVCDVYARCEMQCLLSKTIFRMSYFEVYGLFHLSINVLVNRSEETSNNTDNLLVTAESIFEFETLLRNCFTSQAKNFNILLEINKKILLAAR